MDRYSLAALGLIGMVSILHFAIIDIPRAYVFDEFYYVPQALGLLSGDKIPFSHPPLGVYLIAFGIAIFGNRGLGWRFSSVVFGVLSIGILYLLVHRSTRNRSIALFSSTLYAFDSLTFVQSSVAMLDVFLVFFMLLGFLLYWRNRRILACIMMALSTLCKLVGVLGFGALLLMMLLEREKLRNLLEKVIVYVLFVALAFWGFSLAQGVLLDPFSALAKMAWHITVARTVPSVSIQPWYWLIDPKRTTFLTYQEGMYDVLRPYGIWYRGVGNPMIWLLTLPAIAGVVCDYVRHRRKFSLFVLVWFVMVYLVPWYPIALLSLRPLYLYYFLPAMGAVTTSISIGFANISGLLGEKLSKMTMSAYLIVVVAFFITEFPIRL